MAFYILRRIFLIIPTLLGIMLISFTIIQFAPGGPVERIIAQLQGNDTEATSRLSGSHTALSPNTSFTGSNKYRGSQGLAPEFIAELEKQFGFDQPAHKRFIKMIRDYLRFDFGESYYRNISVIALIGEKLPVSISLGLWTTLITYLISIPLGIAKAQRNGSPFDSWTSSLIIIGYAIPGFMFAILMIVLFAGGSYLDWFPLRGLISENFDTLSFSGKIIDYLWHIFLPVLTLTIGACATSSLLIKNSFLDEISKQYVITARAKGLNNKQVLYRHVFRNAMLIIVSGFPSAFVSVFFTGSLLIETIFSLDGLGLLAYESIINRDYPVVFATLYIFSLLGLFITLISDLVYTWIDPRIHFSGREI